MLDSVDELNSWFRDQVAKNLHGEPTPLPLSSTLELTSSVIVFSSVVFTVSPSDSLFSRVKGY